MHSIFCRTLLVYAISAITPAFGQSEPITVPGSLPETIVTAPREYQWIGPAVGGSTGFSPISQQEIVRIGQMNMIGARLQDVRCSAATDLVNTTSHADEMTRFLAASSVYVNLRTASEMFRSRIIGQVINPSDGKTYKAFQVTYADGGREKWMIFPTPASSAKLIDPPLPGSLVLGDGVAKPSPYCPQRG